MAFAALPLPLLEKKTFDGVEAYTDSELFDACGVRIGFSTRAGGVSEGAYSSLNLGSNVEDDLAKVKQNRAILHAALSGGSAAPFIVPKQVHEDTVLTVRSASEAAAVQAKANEGADALVVTASGVAANLCFADCCPLIAVAPTGAFTVIHAGWRGVDNLIAVKSVRMLAAEVAPEMGVSEAEALAQINVYIGAHIHAECFETSAEIHQRFVDQFGTGCIYDATHIDLNYCERKQLTDAGIAPERIADICKCTVCYNDEFFSYRGQNGKAGRHGAYAFRAQ